MLEEFGSVPAPSKERLALEATAHHCTKQDPWDQRPLAAHGLHTQGCTQIHKYQLARNSLQFQHAPTRVRLLLVGLDPRHLLMRSCGCVRGTPPESSSREAHEERGEKGAKRRKKKLQHLTAQCLEARQLGLDAQVRQRLQEQRGHRGLRRFEGSSLPPLKSVDIRSHAGRLLCLSLCWLW